MAEVPAARDDGFTGERGAVVHGLYRNERGGIQHRGIRNGIELRVSAIVIPSAGNLYICDIIAAGGSPERVDDKLARAGTAGGKGRVAAIKGEKSIIAVGQNGQATRAVGETNIRIIEIARSKAAAGRILAGNQAQTKCVSVPSGGEGIGEARIRGLVGKGRDYIVDRRRGRVNDDGTRTGRVSARCIVSQQGVTTVCGCIRKLQVVQRQGWRRSP